MTFVQLIDCRTSRFDEMNRLMDTWVEQTKGKRTATHTTIGKDRGDASHFVEIVEFPSYEDAMRNSGLPETDKVFREMVALCDEMPTFTDLDVVRDEQLYATTARRFFETLAGSGELSALGELVVAEYHDHDPANDQDAVGLEAMRQEVEMWRGPSTSGSRSMSRSPRVTGCVPGGPGTGPMSGTSSGFRPVGSGSP